MTDHKLLELAAKAAGILIGWYEAIPFIVMHGKPVLWNPLTDDGDALRLAVKMDMQTGISNGEAVSICWIGSMGNAREPVGTCKLAATRRAIVRAAAEIGKAMP